MRKKILFLAGMMACCTWAGAQEISKTWVADKGNGTYQNPVLHADYSDPDVCAVGDDFYMTASSFNCIPGIPILHSGDLVNWSLVNYALPVQEPKEFFDKAQHGKGVSAASDVYKRQVKGYGRRLSVSITESFISTGAIRTMGFT